MYSSSSERKLSYATIFFAVSRDEWNTKEDTGKSMKNALYVLWYAKRHQGTSQAEVILNSEKTKPMALAFMGHNYSFVVPTMNQYCGL